MVNTDIFHKSVKPLILWLIVLPTIMYSVSCPSAAAPLGAAAKNPNERMETYESWLNAPWTDNDAAYRDLRRAIDSSLVNSSHPAAIVQQYEDQFRRSPTDPKALFAFGYSSLKAADVPNGIGWTQSRLKLGGLYLPIAASRIRPPHTYNFARLGFLVVADIHSLPLINIGKRLLKHSPNDDEVEYYLATALTFSKVSTERNLAMSYQHDLARRFPDSPRSYRLLGLIYYRTAWLNHSQTDADKSIAAYRRVLELSPKDQTTRSETEVIIKFIQNLQAQWKQNG